MYVCPDCKTPLEQIRCGSCGTQFAQSHGIPILLTRDKSMRSAWEIGASYDRIYSTRTMVWEDQGRTPEFIGYFATLAARVSQGRVLEVGCGEGFLLAELRAAEKWAVDLSAEALQRAQERTDAECAVALAERLPFADDWFDLVISVGVMEHFLDDNAATSEIGRVLRPGGWYLALIHVGRTVPYRLRQKWREYVYPRFRPIRFAQWLVKKIYRPIHQPIQRRYTVASGRACLEDNGFRVDRVIAHATEPAAPLVGPHVVVYVARKCAT